MKFYLLLFLSVINSLLSAAEFRYGGNIGLALNSYNSNTNNDYSTRLSVLFGGKAAWRFGEKFVLVSDLMYERKNYKTGIYITNYDYITLKPAIHYTFYKDFYAMGGFGIGYNIKTAFDKDVSSGNGNSSGPTYVTTDSTTGDPIFDEKKYRAVAIVGFGYKIIKDNIEYIYELGYEYALSNLEQTNDFDGKIHSTYLSVSFLL